MMKCPRDRYVALKGSSDKAYRGLELDRLVSHQVIWKVPGRWP
jgi:hypothetical protein